MKIRSSFLMFFFIYSFISSNAFASNVGSTDGSNLGLGTFNESILISNMQADGKILIGGSFTYYKNNPINHFVRLNIDGSIDNSFLIGSGADNDVTSIVLQNDGKILVGGNFTTFNNVSVNHIVRLNADGSNDNSFNIGTGANNNIRSIAIQYDGKILIGGDFTLCNGVLCNRVIRLNTDGSVDNTFSVGTGANDYVASIVLQKDGKIIVGGFFSTFNQLSLHNLVRLNADGSVDNTFNIGTGATYLISTTVVQDDGKILIGGYFTYFNGVPKQCITRLNPDGSIDTSFDIGSGANIGSIFAIVLLPNGQILLGGDFTVFNGVASNRLIRLNINGSIDNTFDIGSGASSRVATISVQNNGKLIVGGSFPYFNNKLSTNLIRLDAVGTVDGTFSNQAWGANAAPSCIKVQADGKILVGGHFTIFNDIPQNYLTRLNSDGSIDNTFAIGTSASDNVLALCIQPDGKILVGGDFTLFNGVAQNRLIRLNLDGTIDNTFNVGIGANNKISAISIQTNGKIVIGGDFTSFNSVTQNGLVRLNTDGTMDTNFNIGTGISSSLGFGGLISTIVFQPDNKILIGGNFDTYNGVSTTRYFLRLNADGTLDNTFHIGVGANGGISTIILQADGKILLGGGLDEFNGSFSNYLFRLNPDGSVDNTFNIGSGCNTIAGVAALVLQSNGKIIVGGWFTSFNGVYKGHLVRLNTDGSIDNSFDVGSGTSACVFNLALQADGKIIAGGAFTKCNERSQNYVVRIEGDIPLMLSVSKTNVSIANKENSSASIDVTSNIVWSVSSDQSWLVVNPNSSENNATITLTAAENTGIARIATVTITYSNGAKIINVTQSSGIATSISKNTINKDKYCLYPNPTKLSFSITSEEATLVSIYNQNGVLVMQKSIIGNEPIQIDNFSAGLYFVTLKNNETIITRSLVVE